MRSARAAVAALLMCAGAAAPAPSFAADANTRVHHSVPQLLAAPREAPRRVLVVEPQISVYELSAGGVTEKVPDRSQAAVRLFSAAVSDALAARGDVVAVPMPRLSDAQQDAVDDLISTYEVVAGEAFSNTRPGLAGWEDRAARFDYTLGYGLPELKAATGADWALIVFGVDYQSTGGRKAMAVLGAIGGVVVPTGYASVRTGLVDLATGDILWLHVEGTGTGNLSDESAMRSIVQATLASLPKRP